MNWIKTLANEARNNPEMQAGVALLRLMSDGETRSWCEIHHLLRDHTRSHVGARLTVFIKAGRMRRIKVDGRLNHYQLRQPATSDAVPA